MSDQARKPVRLGDERAWRVLPRMSEIHDALFQPPPPASMAMLLIQIHPTVVRVMNDEMNQFDWELQQISAIPILPENLIVHRNMRRGGIPPSRIEMLERLAEAGDDRWTGTRIVLWSSDSKPND